jgi:hypothetical protein
MHNKILVTLVAFLVMAGSAEAISTPMPVSFHILNEGVLSGYTVEMTNMRSGETQFLTTDATGFVLYDWSNSELGWMPYDSIRITVTSCAESSECTRTVDIDSKGSPIYFTIDLTGTVCPVVPECPDKTCTKVECQDVVCQDFECPDVTCPTCPDVSCPECPDVVCPDAPAPEECPSTPDSVWYWIAGAFAYVLGLGTKKLHEVWKG